MRKRGAAVRGALSAQPHFPVPLGCPRAGRVSGAQHFRTLSLSSWPNRSAAERFRLLSGIRAGPPQGEKAAQNPKVAGSNPAPAIYEAPLFRGAFSLPLGICEYFYLNQPKKKNEPLAGDLARLARR